MPNGVKAELDKFCKKKDLKISRWIVSMIMKEMEKILQKKYDIVLKKFVEIEGKCERKTKKLS